MFIVGAILWGSFALAHASQNMMAGLVAESAEGIALAVVCPPPPPPPDPTE